MYPISILPRTYIPRYVSTPYLRTKARVIVNNTLGAGTKPESPDLSSLRPKLIIITPVGAIFSGQPNLSRGLNQYLVHFYCCQPGSYIRTHPGSNVASLHTDSNIAVVACLS